MDNKVLKSIILSLSEEERIKFLLDKNNGYLHFERLENKEDKIEIFNSLSEENKLRIFREYTTISYEDQKFTYIPFLEGSSKSLYGELVNNNLTNESKMEILRDSDNQYDYILQILKNIIPGRCKSLDLEGIILELDNDSKMEILRNNNNQYDNLFGKLEKDELEEIVFSIEYIDNEAIEILNKYLLHYEEDKIKSLSDKVKRFAKIDERILSVYRYDLINYLQNESDEKIQYLEENLKQLEEINEDILSTCEFELLTEKYKKLKSKLDVITCDKKVQEKIIKLNENQYNIVTQVLDIIEEDNVKDWIPILDNLLNGLNNKKYSELVESIKETKITDRETIRKLASILTDSENIFNIQDIEEVKEFDRIQYVENIKQGKLKTKYIKSLNEIEKLKLCILEKKYGQSLEESKRLLTRYGKSLDEFETNDENDIKIKSYLESIRNILNTNNIKTLEEIYTSNENLQENYLFSNIIESKIREYFAREYNRVLYKPQDKDKIDIDMPLADGIDIYNVGGNFIIELTSLGAYSGYDVNANFNDEWNRKLIKSHGFCTTPIANNNMATARIRYLALGFSNFAENSLLLSAPWDIVSTDANEEMNTSKYEDGEILYEMPKNLIDDIRHTHPENVRERRALEKGKVYKKQPNYIVYIPEISLEKYLELQKQGKLDDIEERKKLLIEYAQNDTIWQNTTRASKEFAKETEDGKIKPLPIAILDRTHIAIKEKEKIDNLEKEFKRTSNPDLIKKIIVESENNRTGNTFCDQIRDNLFSPQILQDRIAKIEEIIKNLETIDSEKANKCKQMLIETTIEEEQKYQRFEYGNKGYKTKPGYNHNKYLQKWIEEFNKPDNISEFRRECLGPEGKQEIAKIVKEIDEMPEYPIKGIHSKRHAQNVTLFSYMIANKEGILDDKSKKLLLQAAKYHDSGRYENYHGGKRADGKDEHAKYSTIVAENNLKKQGFSSSEIAIIKTVILYHEQPEKKINEFDEAEFMNMCLKFGVQEQDIEKTKIMCKYLKDADALDRTRFQGRGTLQAKYLRTNTAKALIGEAKRINNKYRELEKTEEDLSIIHIIDEYELEENNNRVSESERREATQVIDEIMKKSELEVDTNG